MSKALSRRDFLSSVAAIGLVASHAPGVLAQEQPVRGGILNVHMNAEQRVVNPAIRASVDVYLVGSKIVEPLVDLDAKGQPVGVLATGWTSSPDGRTITFTLRQNVRWHDGKPFTAADVQFTAMEIWKKHLNYGTTLQKNLEAVETPDAHTAVFKYAQPMPLDLLLRALPDLGYVAPKHVYEGTNILENPANLEPIGTGPFKFARYERGQYFIADRNPDYWRTGFPYLDRIVWKFMPDKSAAAAALETGAVDLSAYTSLALADIDRLRKHPGFTVSTKGNEGNAVQNTVEFNLRRKELADLRVRRAIVHAIDTDFFIENMLYGFGRRGRGPVPQSSDFFVPGAPDLPFDRALANKLLDEAGYPRGNGPRFKLRLLPAPWGEDVSAFGTFIQQSLAEVGIQVDIVQRDAAGFLNQVYRDWDFDLATGRHQYRSDPAVSTTVWYRSGAPKGAPWTNQWGWQDDAIDRVIDQAAAELDPKARKQRYVEFVKLANEQAPVWMATDREFISVTSKALRNDHNTPRWPSSSWHDLWVKK
ncbi:ABC transporter substrate-binding protein [Bosea sp. TWI1241]|uniref:ABC transporter substrate-binding protein n=1 Tax=Bosea sp. TWI1241 TaxID=3148904 RepID=UPI003207CD4F